jgi:hypothetical protein
MSSCPLQGPTLIINDGFETTADSLETPLACQPNVFRVTNLPDFFLKSPFLPVLSIITRFRILHFYGNVNTGFERTRALRQCVRRSMPWVLAGISFLRSFRLKLCVAKAITVFRISYE